MKRCSAILLAAGRSQRLGFDKILTPLCGKPVLLYSLESLMASTLIHEVIILTRPDVIPAIEALIEPLPKIKPVRVMPGGKERQDSVYEGLKAVDSGSSHVLIHDGARPLLSVGLIARILEVCEETGASVAAHRATDTLKKVDEDGVIEHTVDRAGIWMMETPQVFARQLITAAYERVIREGLSVTDDASTVELGGGKVRVVESDALNLKITRGEDWKILELWLQRGELTSLREDIHQLSNVVSPLVGYLPLLEKYGGMDEKFKNYFQKSAESLQGLQELLHRIQQRVRLLFKDPL
ncbi:MAG: 2-C-methyl-D-erythritol 4-phosphate cytidylyltransferase [Blastochloris sp.]|nr:2-C-methyl-D-erythritol 4-phosphate cytidylyltransferase [Blastochloris sp.]